MNGDETTWALVEVFGHKRFAGKVSEATFAGQAFVRLEVPEVEGVPGWSRLLSPSSVFSLTPLDEATARAAARSLAEVPVDRWLVRPALPMRDDDAGVDDAYEVWVGEREGEE